MTAFSDYLEAALLGVTLLGSSYTPGETIYLALATSVTTDGAVFTEVPSGTAYARQRVQFGSPTNDGTKKKVSNSGAVTYSEATTPWGGITHIGLYDSPTGGNQLYYGALTSTRTIETGDTFQVPDANLSVSLD
ncbi:hypothetical protein DTL42_19445 [Bremerella cremea]|uniref:Uncharacterized protein n=1 Tax=Bremerella cremea TaxID=1031537 RepID=A0A368KPU9_9BACT|nr:hypothetical protein [Bremerella cremea]RCS42315.1 hypothetical protein DTL42_19445 [Bremerella cremea]